MDEVNSDAYDLFGGSDDKESSEMSKKMDELYEMLLAEIVFSSNDPRLDIVEKADRTLDPNFMAWLAQKVERSVDPEEKMALRDLNEMILDTKQKMELTQARIEREEGEKEDAEAKRVRESEEAADLGRGMSDTDVLRKAGTLDNAKIKTAMEESAREEKRQTFYDTEITPEIRASYETLLSKILPPHKPGETTKTVVFNLYDQCDAQLLKVLTERAASGDDDSKAVLDAIAEEQQKRVSQAAERLKSILGLGDPRRMEGAIVKMAREGGVDEAFLLLLEANADQAKQAGAMGASELMQRLRSRAIDEKDKQMTSKEIRLLRKLLRTDAVQERETLLVDAFTPKDVLIVPGTAENAAKAAEGEAPEEEKPLPEVAPPDFINACKAVLLNFGNLDDGKESGDMTTRIKLIASEAEVIATRIYGKGMTNREQQDRAWKEESTSIFDLETLEIEAERMGDTAPWANPENDDILPGFDAGGKMKIGGI